MPLTTQQRSQVWGALMRAAAEDPVPGTITKADLRAAVDACDDWIDANAASFNAALPQPFRGQANLNQKILLLAFVLERRRRAIGGSP